MDHLFDYKIFESSQGGTKVLFVTGDDDYHSLSFEQEYSGTKVSDIINNIEKYKSDEWELKVFSFNEVDINFVKFIRQNIQDYDDSKHKNFYLESEIIK